MPTTLKSLFLIAALYACDALAATSIRDALFVNASTSGNKTSVIRLINPSALSGNITASAYNEAGNRVGTANVPLGTIASQQMLGFTSAQLEAAIGYAPDAGTAKYRVVFDSDLPSFELINFVKDLASGSLTSGQAQTDHRVPPPATSSMRNALFVNPSSSQNKTSVLRLINLSDQSATLSATAYNEAGSVVGTPNAALGQIGGQQMLTFTSPQLEAAIGYLPASGTAKYRVAFTANLPSVELINFIKDIASGNLTLGQAQTDNRTAAATNPSVRNAFYLNPSTNTGKTSVIRLINLDSQSGSVTATAYDEAGSAVGTANAPLGPIAAGQMLGFTSAQLEAALGYAPASPSAKYRVVVSANLTNFELINFIKDVATGNLVLAQDLIDDRAAGSATSSERNALFVNASTSLSKTTVLRLINPNGASGAITATAYNEAGSIVGNANAALGTIAAQQMLTFNAAQLEAAIAYTPASATAKYHIAFSANLPGFEVLSFIETVEATPPASGYGNMKLASLGIGANLNGAIPFPADNPWNTDISAAPVDPNSDALIASIGLTRGLHPDFGSGLYGGAPIGIPYVVVGSAQPKVPMLFVDYADESDPGPYPVPADAPIEGKPVDGSDFGGDRHVLVIDRDANRLYEIGNSYPQSDGSWQASGGALFQLDSNLVRPGGQAGWTSADAAGMPIFPGLVRYEEAASGMIRHAFRFTVSSSRRAYVPPATHWASSNTSPNLPPMGMRVRLKAGYMIPASFSAESRAILQAMKTYGMLMADNGSNWYVSGAPDARWNNDALVSELGSVKGANFEVVRMDGMVTP
jgi:hypothetical protein